MRPRSESPRWISLPARLRALSQAAWQEYVADDVADCGVKSYLSMFKNDPETLTVFFFKDSTNLAKDGRMREHVTRSFTVTGHMINLATKPVEFREKMERLGAAHGMKGVTREFVDALGAPFSYFASRPCCLRVAAMTLLPLLRSLLPHATSPSISGRGILAMLADKMEDDFTPLVCPWRLVCIS